MLLQRLLSSQVVDALQWTARFSEARHRVLAENVANIHTPNFRAKGLDPQLFRRNLRDALESADAGQRPLELRDDAQTQRSANGQIRFEPTPHPTHLQFHDGTQTMVESLMSDVAQNALSYEMATALLRTRFDGMLSAIRGRTQ